MAGFLFSLSTVAHLTLIATRKSFLYEIDLTKAVKVGMTQDESEILGGGVLKTTKQKIMLTDDCLPALLQH